METTSDDKNQWKYDIHSLQMVCEMACHRNNMIIALWNEEINIKINRLQLYIIHSMEIVQRASHFI